MLEYDVDKHRFISKFRSSYASGCKSWTVKKAEHWKKKKKKKKKAEHRIIDAF